MRRENVSMQWNVLGDMKDGDEMMRKDEDEKDERRQSQFQFTLPLTGS